MRFLINRAFNTNNREQVTGLPNWADTERFDIIAKAASTGPSAPALDNECVGSDDARVAGGSLQNDLSHGRPAGIRLYVGFGEAEDEEGRSFQSHFLQEQPSARRCAAGFADLDLPEHHHGAIRGSVAKYGRRS